MITRAKELKLIQMYLFIRDMYNQTLKYSCQRFSNNAEPAFTDPEVMTIYLYGMSIEHRYKVKDIYEFASDHLRSWFPLLPSYVAFNQRINRLGESLRILSEYLIETFRPLDCSPNNSLLDSMPIITCSGKRKAKVAIEITDKGYCSTKGIYYYGLKLNALAFVHPGTIPFPEEFVIVPASENDLNVFKRAWADIMNRIFYGDKIYYNIDYFQDNQKTKNSIMLTPIKAVQKQPECLKKRDKAYNDLYSAAVSRIRQPIESLFNWLIEKTNIQCASKVRSLKGLLVFVFGRLAAAYISPVFNP
jgi:hypothetical protein